MAITPIIYYWEHEGLMTAAFEYQSLKYGLSFPIVENQVKKRFDKKKLIRVVSDSLHVLIAHGKEILDVNGQIDWKKVNDLEAKRAFFDKQWVKKIRFINKAITRKEITVEEARKLKLL